MSKEETQASMQMPKYKCHKEVWALKIAKIENIDEEHAIITPVEIDYAPFEVNAAYVKKHDPKVGGYYVVYKDGYKSFSPAEAFEDGYTKIQA